MWAAPYEPCDQAAVSGSLLVRPGMPPLRRTSSSSVSVWRFQSARPQCLNARSHGSPFGGRHSTQSHGPLSQAVLHLLEVRSGSV